jgi:hypothetical protein
MGLQNSPVGSHSWLSALLSWIRLTVKHSDLVDVKPAAYENDGTMDKHISSVVYKRSIDHVADNSRHLTDFLDGSSNYVGSISSSNELLVVTKNGNAYTLNVPITLGQGVKITGSEISLDVEAGYGMAITPGNPTILDANIGQGNGITVSGVSPRVIHAHHFAKTVQIVSTAADTPVIIVSDSEVPSGMHVVVEGFYGYIYGVDDWTPGGFTLTDVRIEDASSNELFHINRAKLIGNAIIAPSVLGATEITPRLIAGSGSDTGKGIQAVGWNGVAHVAAGSGSDLWLTVYGVIR